MHHVGATTLDKLEKFTTNMEVKKGGRREGSGRKSKADEQSLIEKLTPLEPRAFEALTAAIEDHKDWAVKLFFQYKFGMPKQVIDQNTTHTMNDFDIKDIVNFK